MSATPIRKCPTHPGVEFTSGASCPFCHPSSERPVRLQVDLSSIRREAAKADAELSAIVPSLAVVAP